MLRHIVMMKFNEDAKYEVTHVKEMLQNLLDTVESLKKMEVGINISKKPSAYDLVLTADFDSEEGLEAYRNHPDHVRILDVMKETVNQVSAVDYWL